jgi:hypothetical protein
VRVGIVGAFLVFVPSLLYFSIFFIPAGFKKMAIKGVFLVYGKSFCLKPKE